MTDTTTLQILIDHDVPPAEATEASGDYDPMITYDECAFEFSGFDLDGRRRWGATYSECWATIAEANRVIAEHWRKCPEDRALPMDGADEVL